MLVILYIMFCEVLIIIQVCCQEVCVCVVNVVLFVLGDVFIECYQVYKCQVCVMDFIDFEWEVVCLMQ